MMLAILNKGLVNPPQELHSPEASLCSSRKPKLPEEIVKDFVAEASDASRANFTMSFGDAALLAHVPQGKSYLKNQSLFCGLDGIYCMFLGSLNNLCGLNEYYGLSKGNEAMFVIEAYRTLRDRGPYPAHRVLQDLDGRFGFVVYDTKAGQVFTALGKGVGLFWGIAADGSVVISDNLELMKGSCAKSFAPFPSGCMFHSGQGLMSFEHPTSKMKAMSRVDSEGAMCGANFEADVHGSRISSSLARVGSEANWALGGSQA